MIIYKLSLYLFAILVKQISFTLFSTTKPIKLDKYLTSIKQHIVLLKLLKRIEYFTQQSYIICTTIRKLLQN